LYQAVILQKKGIYKHILYMYKYIQGVRRLKGKFLWAGRAHQAE